jgi:hypothetical protein
MGYSAINARSMDRKGLRLLESGGKILLSAIVFCTGMTLLAKWTLSDLSWAEVICSENGPLERMSAGLWFMVFCWCVAVSWGQTLYRKEWLALSTLFLLFGLRELDAQRWVTGWNLDKLVNYWNPEFPLWEKLLVTGLMLIPLLAVGAFLLHRIWACMAQTTTGRAPWMGKTLLGVLLLLVCLLLDKGLYVLIFLGIEDKKLWIMGLEELSEFLLAAYVVAVLWPYWLQALFEMERKS